jgi:hypothetical protein
MTILTLYYPQDGYAAEIVSAALRRSFTSAQVDCVTYGAANPRAIAAVLLNPRDAEIPILRNVLSRGGKALVLGQIGSRIADELGLSLQPEFQLEEHWAAVDVNQTEPWNVSLGAIRYCRDHPLGVLSVFDTRHLCRYDFTNEWNNLSYGRILLDGSCWSVACVAKCTSATEIAWLEDGAGQAISTYASLADSKNGAVLWINRTVGMVDSLEWRIIEDFFGNYRSDDLLCLAYISEIPYGYRGAVTVRLDCDQAVASARPLFNLYRSMKLPLSLALLTGLPIKAHDRDLIHDVVRCGGSLLSHSVSHLQRWGQNYDTALNEAHNSRRWIEDNFPHASPVRYAVSPFHQNPLYAVEALAHAGYKGFVGGTIHNDPEFLIGRAGRVPFVNHAIVSHTQQCMLHGDCFHRYGNSIDPYRQSFENHVNSGAMFGYLDHPFSDQYQYGWNSEQERLEVHESLVRHIQSLGEIWWCSSNECLDFILKRDSALLIHDDKGPPILTCSSRGSPLTLVAMWKGRAITET